MVDIIIDFIKNEEFGILILSSEMNYQIYQEIEHLKQSNIDLEILRYKNYQIQQIDIHKNNNELVANSKHSYHKRNEVKQEEVSEKM